MKKNIKVFNLLFIALTFAYGLLVPQSAMAQNDRLNDNCPLSLNLSAPETTSDWSVPFDLKGIVTRNYALGFFCSTTDVIKIKFSVSNVGEIGSVTVGIDPDPTGSGRTSTATGTFNFKPSNFRIEEPTSSINITAVGEVTRKAGFNTSNLTLNSNSIAVRLARAQVGNYDPMGITVTNLTSTGARISWKTVSPSNSEIVYGKDTETLDSDNNKPNFQRGTTFDNTSNHFLNLSGLSPGTKYKYIVRSSPNANTTSTKSSEMTFTTKNADGTGGSTNTNTNTNPSTPNGNINTNVGVSIGNLDQVIGSFSNPLTKNTLPEILASLLRILFALIGTVAVIIIIVSGFRMVLASGNEQALTKAKQAITWAIVGLIVSLMAFSIVAIVQKLIQS